MHPVLPERKGKVLSGREHSKIAGAAQPRARARGVEAQEDRLGMACGGLVHHRDADRHALCAASGDIDARPNCRGCAVLLGELGLHLGC